MDSISINIKDLPMTMSTPSPQVTNITALRCSMDFIIFETTVRNKVTSYYLTWHECALLIGPCDAT